MATPPHMHDELFLIDGNSLAYRAFFALPESIATSDGFPTNAIFGFASMLVKILTEYGPRSTIVAWDRGHSGRREVYPEYKAQRSSRPDLFKQQWPHLEPLVDAFGYANVSLEGFEADDVIATLAEQAKARGIPVKIVTGDRDSFQLVDDGVEIMATARGITETRIYDRQGVIDRYGIVPELVPDFIGLKGDTSDNIPGVPGIGDKTAAQLLQQFGTLEGVLEHAHEIRATRRRENLIAHAEDARISKQLATMRRDLPVEIDVEAIATARPDRSRLREVFREFELRDPLRRIEEALADSDDEAAPRPEAEQAIAVAVRRGGAPADLAALAPAGAEIAVAAREPEKPDGALFGETEAWRFGAYAGADALAGECGADGAGPELLAAALGERPVLAHDAKALKVVPQRLVHDTLIAAYLLDPARRGYPLAELAEERGLAAKVDDEAAADAVLIHALTAAQRVQLQERDLVRLMDEIELPLVRVLRQMEAAGLKLDTDLLATIRTRVMDEATALEREIFELTGEEFMIGSPQQLGAILFEKLGLSRKRRGKTGYSTDARVLQAIRHEHPVIEKIERWRELTKLASTYLDAFPTLISPDDHRLHTTFGQVTAATGRLSSTNPNLQNIPIRTPLGREIRACFIAEPGNVLISADYSQVELRVLAHIAGEEVLKEIFRRGEDVHTATAASILGVDPEQLDAGSRSKAKMVNYGIVYGLSAFGLADRLQIPQAEAQEFIDRYLDGFPAVREFIRNTIEQATDQGYVTTLMGRRRQIPELRARNFQMRQLGERLAVNTVIQGTAADVIKLAMVNADRALRESGMTTRLILQIHDELLFEGPAEEAERARDLVVPMMVDALELDPPLTVDAGIGPNWLDAK
ncbi:DNA polymerase I [Conexibacter sp. CPCC 206217]|uniref:DNA polymerase I n=1 Tax=Conexibacter sp. CPCC 206217 TaxID=3064574 RepID=UPI0027267622|nr:DNA polymerase I [Conexibacter sp. CPCC 206217]MDO8210962.1 DNA polymerase I [Conexibacter sp. CPCC 206217]